MKISTKQRSRSVKLLTVVGILILLVLLAGGTLWFVAFRNSNTDSSAPTRPLSAAESELRNSALTWATICLNDTRSKQDRIAQLDAHLRVNKAGDRGIVRRCNDIDSLFAKTSDGTWFPLFTIKADDDQDNDIRKACNIEDITTGFDDTRSENAGAKTSEIEACDDVDAAYQATLHR